MLNCIFKRRERETCFCMERDQPNLNTNEERLEENEVHQRANGAAEYKEFPTIHEVLRVVT